jgi:hypothetical protein
MSLENFSIATDMSFMNGPCTHSSIVLNTPVNVREVPCDTCSLADYCSIGAKECVAVRVWYRLGNYEDKDIGRLMRKAKS